MHHLSVLTVLRFLHRELLPTGMHHRIDCLDRTCQLSIPHKTIGNKAMRRIRTPTVIVISEVIPKKTKEKSMPYMGVCEQGEREEFQ